MSSHSPSILVDLGIRRVERTFAFIDLCGFTDHADASGDEAAVAELALLRSLVRTVVPRFGVRVDKWLGDGALLVAVECEALVSAVVTLVDRFHRLGRLPLRAGVAGGSVVLLEGDDYVGRPVNLAARLCDLCPPGTVLAAADVSLPEGVRAVPSDRITVKGMLAPVDTVELQPI
jgi:class 3 adenylate cyclase